MHRTVEFKSALANSWQFDAAGNPTIPGGRETAEKIAAALRAVVSSITPVIQHRFYGWRFDAVFANNRFVHVLNSSADIDYLTIDLPWSRMRALLRQHPRELFETYCWVLEAALKTLAEISAIRWQ